MKDIILQLTYYCVWIKAIRWGDLLYSRIIHKFMQQNILIDVICIYIVLIQYRKECVYGIFSKRCDSKEEKRADI